MPDRFITYWPTKGSAEEKALKAARSNSLVTARYRHEIKAVTGLVIEGVGRDAKVLYAGLEWRFVLLGGRAYMTKMPPHYRLDVKAQAAVEKALRVLSDRADAMDAFLASEVA